MVDHLIHSIANQHIYLLTNTSHPEPRLLVLCTSTVCVHSSEVTEVKSQDTLNSTMHALTRLLTNQRQTNSTGLLYDKI